MTEPDRDPEPDAGGPPTDPDAVWRAIVANYGDRPPAEDLPPPEPVDPVPAWRALDDAEFPPVHDEEHYVPPEPPPVPRLQGPRAAGWIGLFGAPAVGLLCVIFGISLPPEIGVLLVAAFVGGFVYLVATMRKDAGDGWDDGAVV